MAFLQWALTCSDISVDDASNNITYRDAIEQVRFAEFPTELPPSILISMLWRRDDIDTPESLQYRIIAENEAGEVADTSEAREVSLEKYERVRATTNNPIIHVENPGTVWFRIQKNENGGWEDCTALPVEIKEMEEPPR